jgi:hypothetical protein
MKQLALGLIIAIGLTLPAVAQQKQQVAFRTPAENSKYTQQLTIDVGDVPNHVIRVFQIHYTFPSNQPVINGIKLVELWENGIGDRLDGNGPLTSYGVYVMENGDKLFTKTIGVIQNTAGKLTNTNVGNLTGGTGTLAGIQGTIRQSGNFNYTTGFAEGQTEIEYLIDK